LSDKELIVVISGTSRGIGMALAEYFLSKEYIVYGCSRGESTINHNKYLHETLDISNEQQVSLWARKIKRTGIQVNALICNAGTSSATSLFLSTQLSQFNNQINTNITGTYILCKEFGKIFLQQKMGRIVNFSSVLAGMHEEGTSIYSATKKAIEELTKVIAKEMAPFNVTCNCVAPGMVITPLTESLGEVAIKNVILKQNIKRAFTTNEVCNIVDFFIKPESSCITGQVIYMGLVC
jgi:3-oxoacyl-[acyl-carrier protein] reductase